MKLKQGTYYKRRCKREPWYMHYWGMVLRCRHKKHYKGIYPILTMKGVEFLYKRDNARNLKRASLDRINPKGHYTIDNCRFIELSENVSRARKESKGQVNYAKKVFQLDLNNTVLNEFPSRMEAQRQTGVAHQNIHKVVDKKRKTAGGYKWSSCVI